MSRAVTDHRGTFVQGETTTLFIALTDFQGDAVDPVSISISIEDDSMTEVTSGTPDKLDTGYYAFDWSVDDDQAAGQYYAVWTYDLGSGSIEETQAVVVAANADTTATDSLYTPVLVNMRAELEQLILCAQRIPVYDEQARAFVGDQEYALTFARWNQSAGVRVYRNQKLINSGYEIDYFNGRVIFDEVMSDYDVINADYNFRWFSDEQLDRFLQNALHEVNTYPPQDGLTFNQLVSQKPYLIATVMYAAAANALRELMMCLQFQQPQQVFGGREAAQQAFSNIETLKKNYEGKFDGLIEQKKNFPYVGLTRSVVTPEYTLPGGRSRWFRYLFKGGG